MFVSFNKCVFVFFSEHKKLATTVRRNFIFLEVNLYFNIFFLYICWYQFNVCNITKIFYSKILLVFIISTRYTSNKVIFCLIFFVIHIFCNWILLMQALYWQGKSLIDVFYLNALVKLYFLNFVFNPDKSFVFDLFLFWSKSNIIKYIFLNLWPFPSE